LNQQCQDVYVDYVRQPG